MIYQIYGVLLPNGTNTLLVRNARSAAKALAELENTNHGQYDRIIMVTRPRLSAMIEDYSHVADGQAVSIARMDDLGVRLGYLYFDPIVNKEHGYLFWKYVTSDRADKRQYIKYDHGTIPGRMVDNPTWIGYLVQPAGEWN